jgi:hypothetical protein
MRSRLGDILRLAIRVVEGEFAACTALQLRRDSRLSPFGVRALLHLIGGKNGDTITTLGDQATFFFGIPARRPQILGGRVVSTTMDLARVVRGGIDVDDLRFFFRLIVFGRLGLVLRITGVTEVGILMGPTLAADGSRSTGRRLR